MSVRTRSSSRAATMLVAAAAALLVPATSAASATPSAASATVSTTSAAATPAVAGRHLPTRYVVSTEPGVLPEGIATTPSGRLYVTSSATGDLFTGHVSLPTLHRLAPGSEQGRSRALGIHPDARGRLLVASDRGVDVLAPDGRLLDRSLLPEAARATSYLNDLAVTRDAVYVTDSATATVWRAPLSRHGIGDLEPWLDVRAALRPDFQPGWFYLNGIAASPDGSRLLVSAQGLGALVRVDVPTRAAAFVVTDGSVFGAFGPDGMVLRGDTVHGVLSYGAPDTGQGLYVARLSDDWSTATVLAHDTDGFSTPSTLARWADRFLVVNSQLDTAPGTPPWTVSSVRDPRR